MTEDKEVKIDTGIKTDIIMNVNKVMGIIEDIG